MFLWNSLAFLMIQQMLAIWSLVPLPFLKPAWRCESSRLMYCWSLAWRILSITLLTRDECNCAVVWAFFGIAFLWDWNENWPSPVLWPVKIQTSLKAQSVEHAKAQSVKHALSIRPAGPDVLGPLSGADCACAAADIVQALRVRPDSRQCRKRTCHGQESEVCSVSHTWLPGSNVF